MRRYEIDIDYFVTDAEQTAPTVAAARRAFRNPPARRPDQTEAAQRRQLTGALVRAGQEATAERLARLAGVAGRVGERHELAPDGRLAVHAVVTVVRDDCTGADVAEAVEQAGAALERTGIACRVEGAMAIRPVEVAEPAAKGRARRVEAGGADAGGAGGADAALTGDEAAGR